jgi:hypothetical protein
LSNALPLFRRKKVRNMLRAAAKNAASDFGKIQNLKILAGLQS